MIRAAGAAAMLWLVAACASTPHPQPAAGHRAVAGQAVKARLTPAAPAAAPRPQQPVQRATRPPPPPNTKDVARAKRAYEHGLADYKRGDYNDAEAQLKEAITLYPFLPQANLALGKIFLIEGSAKRDMALINSARLMFEMAHALDPQLREPELLLQLFQNQPK